MQAERLLAWTLLAGLGLGCARVLMPFASAIVWAVILVFCSWPVHAWLRRRRLGPVGAAIMMVTGFAVLAALPVALAAPGGAADAAALNGWVQTWFTAGLPSAPLWLFRLPLIGTTLGDLWNGWAADLSRMFAFFKPYLGALATEGLSLLLGIAHAVVAIVLSLFISFFLFLSGDALHERLRNLARRVGGVTGEALLDTIGQTARGTVYALLGMAVVQGVLTWLGLTIAGIGRAPLLGLIAGILSVLPIGAPLIWIPASIWLLASGQTGHGVFLVIYGVAVISGADHLLRPWLISRGSHLPFLLTVLGVLGGVVAFGLVGMFLGPVLLGAGFAVVRTYSEPADGALVGGRGAP